MLYCAYRDASKFGPWNQKWNQKWNKIWRKIGANLGFNSWLYHMVKMETADN